MARNSDLTPKDASESDRRYSAPAGGDATPVSALHDEPINILIVDDEPKNLTVLETVLGDPGYRLVRAESADQALLALVVEEFALIVLDIHMPGMTGFELADMIKGRKKTAAVPIIFLTAHYNTDQHVLEGYRTGAVDYLHKPINPTVLRSKVAVFAELYRKTRECSVANRALHLEVAERRRVHQQLLQSNDELERRVDERTAELSRTHSALRESEGWLAAIVESSGDAIFSCSPPDGLIKSWNAGAERLFGYTKEQAMGRSVFTLLIPEGQTDEVRRIHERVGEGAQIDPFDTVMVRSDGDRVAVSLTVSPVRDAAGGVVWASAICRDITERKRLENELRQYAANLSEADRRKSEFLAMLAHELRNPLAPIRNVLHIMRLTEYDGDAVRSASDMMERQVGQMVRLVDDLLDVSRVSRGKIELRKGRFDLAVVVNAAVEAARPLVDDRNHELTITLPRLPILLEGDPTRIAQVVGNLLNNACKFTSNGGRIALTIEQEGGQAVIRVRDSGIGIAPNELNRIFELFVQVDTSLERSQSGLGIGLTLVQHLVTLHGGALEVHSEGLGQGSEFVVRLPIESGAEIAPASETVVARVESTGTRRILVVDDNRDSATSLAKALSLEGNVTHVAHDGVEAVEAAETFRPNVVLLDIGLPKLNGYEAARKIRALPNGEQIIVVALTGWGQEEDRRKSKEAGFDDHLVKPVDHVTLSNRLAEIARKSA